MAIVAAAEPAPRFARPASGPVDVAVVLTHGANVMDFAGAWEVFQDTPFPGTEEPAFRLYTVSDSRAPLTLTGGLKVVPDYTFDYAPPPAVIVVGAQAGSPRMLQWLRQVNASERTQVLMSVCTGAFKLAQAGILDGKSATTHHDFFDEFSRRFPKVNLVRGERFVQSGPHLFTAGGLTSGVDLALHIVELYFGAESARRTAAYMEYARRGN